MPLGGTLQPAALMRRPAFLEVKRQVDQRIEEALDKFKVASGKFSSSVVKVSKTAM